jgi:hypothetical protein
LRESYRAGGGVKERTLLRIAGGEPRFGTDSMDMGAQ